MDMGGCFLGGHRIRHYGLFASGNRAANIARARQLLGAASHMHPRFGQMHT